MLPYIAAPWILWVIKASKTNPFTVDNCQDSEELEEEPEETEAAHCGAGGRDTVEYPTRLT